MITRYAIFEGALPPHQAPAFRQAVLQRLIPAVRCIPGLQSVDVSFSRTRDPGAPEIVMFLVTTYRDAEAVERALEGPERDKAKTITSQIFEEFVPCRIHHHLTETHRL